MENEKKLSEKSKKTVGSKVLYAAASVVALIAVALLINNILMFKNILNQYVTQGYPRAEVMKQLVPSQLLPGIFEPVALYGGIAVLLMGAGMIYKRLAAFSELPAAVEVESDNACNVVVEDNPVEVKDAEDDGQIEAIEENSENI